MSRVSFRSSTCTQLAQSSPIAFLGFAVSTDGRLLCTVVDNDEVTSPAPSHRKNFSKERVKDEQEIFADRDNSGCCLDARAVSFCARNVDKGQFSRSGGRQDRCGRSWRQSDYDWSNRNTSNGHRQGWTLPVLYIGSVARVPVEPVIVTLAQIGRAHV